MNDMSQVQTDIQKTLGVGKKTRGPWRRRRIGGGGVVSVLGGLVLLLSGGGGGGGVKTEEVKRGPLSVKVTATGTLQPIDQVDVGAEVSGRVVAVNVDFNDLVKKDQILAQIDTTQLDARCTQSEAQLAAAQASVKDAEAGWNG